MKFDRMHTQMKQPPWIRRITKNQWVNGYQWFAVVLVKSKGSDVQFDCKVQVDHDILCTYAICGGFHLGKLVVGHDGLMEVNIDQGRLCQWGI